MKYPISWFLTLTLALGSSLVFATPPQSSSKVTSPAPDFTVPSLDGEASVRLSSLRGQVVVINFWASWCPPCRAEFPLLAKLHTAYKDRGLVLLSLNFAEETAAAQRFVEREKPPFQVYAGATAAAKYDASRLPTTYFIDRVGQIRRQVSGFHPKRTEAEFTAIIDELLAEPIPTGQIPTGAH